MIFKPQVLLHIKNWTFEYAEGLSVSSNMGVTVLLTDFLVQLDVCAVHNNPWTDRSNTSSGSYRKDMQSS